MYIVIKSKEWTYLSNLILNNKHIRRLIILMKKTQKKIIHLTKKIKEFGDSIIIKRKLKENQKMIIKESPNQIWILNMDFKFVD